MDPNRQVLIRGNPSALEAWVRTLADPPARGWSRAVDLERKSRLHPDQVWPICLVWSGEGRHPGATFFLRTAPESAIEIESLLPNDRRRLTLEDKQAALEAFRSDLVEPGGELVLEDREIPFDLEDYVSLEASSYFRSFVETADKTLPPSALELSWWYDFLIQHHRERRLPSRDILATALRQNGFSDEVIAHLLGVLVYAEDILTRYDSFGWYG